MTTDKKIVAKECRSVTHLPGIPNVREDTHIVKEILHYDDGTSTPNLNIISNFKRPYWVVKDMHQNFKQKRESIEKTKCNMYTSTETDLAANIGMRLGFRYIGIKDIRKIRDSPYVFGIDITSSTYINSIYKEKYPDKITNYTVGVYDIEADIQTKEIYIASISTDDVMYTYINKSLLNNSIDATSSVKELNAKYKDRLKKMYDTYIPKTDITTNMRKEYIFVENELEVVLQSIAKSHEIAPDIISVWYINYDMPMLLSVLKKHSIDPKNVFSDPGLPPNLRYFKYKEGQVSKTTASGKITPVNNEAQWHVTTCPASFVWLDAMSAYNYIRVGGKQVPGGYGLDNILKTELGDKLGKLKFDDDPSMQNLKGAAWHEYMVEYKPLEYIIYNQWDNMGMTHLDISTNDLRQVLPMLSGVSLFDIFNSGPKRIVDALHFFYLDNGMVLGTKDNRERPGGHLGLGKWIVILPADRRKENGLKLFGENGPVSNIKTYVYDSDQVSGYPSDGQAANVSRDTTKKEILDIEGFDKDDIKGKNVNLLFGKINALGYGKDMFKLPTLFEVIDLLDKK